MSLAEMFQEQHIPQEWHGEDKGMEPNVVLDVSVAAEHQILGMGLALLPSHLLWKLFPQQPSCWSISTCFHGGFPPLNEII